MIYLLYNVFQMAIDNIKYEQVCKENRPKGKVLYYTRVKRRKIMFEKLIFTFAKFFKNYLYF